MTNPSFVGDGWVSRLGKGGHDPQRTPVMVDHWRVSWLLVVVGRPSLGVKLVAQEDRNLEPERFAADGWCQSTRLRVRSGSRSVVTREDAFFTRSNWTIFLIFLDFS